MSTCGVKCNVCDSENFKVLFKVNEHRIVRCRKCSLTYVNPRLKKDKLYDIYNKEYFSNEQFNKKKPKEIYGYGLYIKEKDNIEKSFKKILEDIERYKKRGQILDVGCATGFFLNLCKKKRWDAYGVDMSKFAIDYAKKEFGLKNLYHGDLDKINLKKSSFDVITMFDVIEHLEDPKKMLSDINSLLKKKGMVVITTPDSGSIPAKLLGKNWEEYKRAREHVYFFSRKTLTKILKKTGFKVVKIKSAGRYLDLNSTMRRLNIQLNGHLTFLERIIRKTGLGNHRIFINPFYKITVYAVKR